MRTIKQMRDSMAEWYDRNENWLGDLWELVMACTGIILALVVAFITFVFSFIFVVCCHAVEGMEKYSRKFRKSVKKPHLPMDERD